MKVKRVNPESSHHKEKNVYFLCFFNVASVGLAKKFIRVFLYNGIEKPNELLGQPNICTDGCSLNLP